MTQLTGENSGLAGARACSGCGHQILEHELRHTLITGHAILKGSAPRVQRGAELRAIKLADASANLDEACHAGSALSTLSHLSNLARRCTDLHISKDGREGALG